MNSGYSTLEIDNLLSSCAIQNINDWTKKIYFDLDEISSSQSRILTVPDSDITLVGTSISQILTNKYIDCNNNTVVNINDSNVKNNANINVSKIGNGDATNTELSNIVNSRSNIQSQIDNHVASVVTHGLTSSIVGTADSQVLTNKILTDTLNYYQNENDNTKKIKFNLSNISPATTRTVTFPDTNITVVDTELHQTLLNKTIDAQNNVLFNISDNNIISDANINASKIGTGTVTNTEFGYLDGLKSSIQTQIDDHTSSVSCHGITGVVVGTTDVQILSNKSFSSEVSMNGNKITSLSVPIDAFDAANKQYVDSVASGLDIKNSVRVCSTVELGSEKSVLSVNYSNTSSLIATFNPNLIIDNVVINDGDRVLLKNQSNPVLNGIWVVKLLGKTANLIRPPDFINVDSGTFMFVEEGDVNKNSGWVLNTSGQIVIGTTELSFTQFSGAGQIITGNGLAKTGNQLDVVGSNTILSTSSGLYVNSSNVHNQILLSSGNENTSAVFGKLPLDDQNSVSGILNVINGGTGVSSFSYGDKIIATNNANNGLVTTIFSPSEIVNLSFEQTLLNKRLDNPVIHNIYDIEKNSVLTLNNESNAVNNISLTNSQANNNLKIYATGKDENINLELNSKGNGQVIINNLKYPIVDGQENWFLKTDGNGNLNFATVNSTVEVTIFTKNEEKTIVSSIQTHDNMSYMVSATIIGNRTDMGSETCGYMLNSLFRNNGKSLVKIGGEKINFEETVAWDGNFMISNNTIEIYVVGEQGKTIEWKCVYSIIKI